MLTEERRSAIVNLIQKIGRVQVNDLSRRFDISEVTIRSDLKELHRRGLVYKSHGGAISPRLVSNNIVIEPSFTLKEKQSRQIDAKSRIGAAAAKLVKNGETIILDSGTTTHEIAKCLKDHKDLTVITNGVNVATELAGHRTIQIILLGGVLRHRSLSIIGHFAEEMLAQLTADKVFMGADGISLEYGISTPKFEESRINQAMMAIAREKYLVADSSKFGKNSLSRIASLWELNGIITDNKLPAEYQKEIRLHNSLLFLTD